MLSFTLPDIVQRLETEESDVWLTRGSNVARKDASPSAVPRCPFGIGLAALAAGVIAANVELIRRFHGGPPRRSSRPVAVPI